MALAAKLQLRQSQSLVMTPQLMQSIRLLQLTHVELERFIDEEIERNPLLERAEPQDDASGDQPQKSEAAAEPASGDDWFEAETEWSAEAISEKLDSSLENLFPDDPGTSEKLGPDLTAQWKSASGGSAGGAASEGFDVGEMAATIVTLREHVGEQIALAFPAPGERLIAGELADSLDEAGYLRADLEEVAARLGADKEAVSRVLTVCQTFEPAGLFARDLAECLSLQLAVRDRLDPAMKALVANLELLARRDFQTLKRICGVDEEDLLDMLAEIRALDPRPGTAFSGGASDAIIADVEVRAAADGSWAVELNADTLPRVLVDHVYFARVSCHARDQAEKEFLAECLQNANWLTRSLDQRAKTILKVASEIVRQQDAFLVHGVRHLKPLNLRTVADAIGMHESTVSRVTANKYMLTPRGVFELRYFFTASIASAEGGEAHSSEAVRDRIKQLIDEEKPADVLSDDAIVDMLRESGVDIARRTVAKYREGMNIPSSVQRRREKRALANAGR
ncbi:RNA polymerase factor sigma-54 [Mesorhizobium sp. M1C.F.Ca.ET.193.01.1.1]|uniref:RNA polymerase factor sigma-54 n=1 Tax=unclassified Mesorhizobium TaxID=325217 RepID=UPI000FD2CBDB|nr:MULTISPECIES: RNA polymerase factor sigma-54 [unclassified Mesorhizobium]TGS99221.1 RNA polymerase factor sigma-54 [bacterium M00.F.Ca.ET.177.01.1.1]TGQ53212.1 RNA polymerase factor sigma-54 [Mesorhizobium sp. M1C.F.Ca.ET.210.01.1.1]TGQ70481.1 RNA polymerase factor sigma-54 [Mesorhizobium sp. M1C.F.Ca.ET.212.01.1.1]TGR07129.1 RNA polymerase factor sigma-54 [Mesorhizobium sp. M1C.F.Ca.ET.204.01.1.1]TGR27700.1 RNA polymerase factor sigma-54 [Mesorhizobium sp. M1C.F.Ca.ET.196.01.1.1]